MMPVLYKCNFFTIYTYGAFVAAAFLVSTSLALQEAKRRRMDENLIYNLTIVLLVGGVVFARLFYIGLNWAYFYENISETIMLQHGGLVWFGGLIGAVISGFAFIKIKRMPVLETLDLLAPYAALAQAIGRIGCFFNGCCYGIESKWGVYSSVFARTLFPSQLLDSLTLLLIFAVLRLLPGKRRAGEIVCFYLILASLQRFFLEFVRGDVRPFYFSLSIFQWISLGLFLLGLVLYFFVRKCSWKKKAA